ISLFWLALTFSGVYLHRKKLLAQFRPGAWGKRKGRAAQSWLHTVAATLALPFHVLYGVTGAFFGLTLIVVPVALVVVFGGDKDAMDAVVEARNPPKQELAEERVRALPDLDPFLADARERYPGTRPSFVSLVEPYDEAARLAVFFLDAEEERGNLVYDLHRSMEPVHDVRPGEQDALFAVLRPVLNLHFAHYGGLPVRLLYFVLGLMLCVLTYAGARMWVMRQRKTAPRAATVCERLFDGFGVGLLPAIGIYAWANRLLPAGLESRLEIESGIFHATWALLAAFVLWRGTGVARRRAMIIAAAGLIAAVPVLDGLVHSMWPWSPAAWHVPSVALIDIVLFAGGLACLAAMRRRKSEAAVAVASAEATPAPAPAE
ncbi:MAG: PepSY-associated TM helix domain-containing protein, partial [Myxococcota bacterium]